MGFRAPKLEELAGELRPDVFDRFQHPRLEQPPVARRTLVAGGGQIGHQEIADDRAEIESHRSVEREFGIDHDGRAFRHHDRAGVEVAVDQRFRCGQEFELQPRDRGVQVEVFPEGGRRRIEPGLRPAVLLGLAVGIGEDQILGDLAERMVAGERGDALLLLGGGNREVGREEQRARQKGRDVPDKARIERAGNQPLAHDDMRLDQLHDDEGERLVVVQHRRHQTGRQPGLMRERQIFVMRARQRQRPALADEPHIGQRLLDGDAARRPP